MVAIKIGLYKHKETGQYDVMIDCIDNVLKVHNGEFEKIKSFEHVEKTPKDLLIEELNHMKDIIKYHYEDYLKPVINGRTSDYLDDKKINEIRQNLYEFMCVRRKLMKVNEFKYEVDE